MSWATGSFKNTRLVAAEIKEKVAAGSDIKSWNGLAKASIKSINGLAIASVKSINGLA